MTEQDEPFGSVTITGPEGYEQTVPVSPDGRAEMTWPVIGFYTLQTWQTWQRDEGDEG